MKKRVWLVGSQGVKRIVLPNRQRFSAPPPPTLQSSWLPIKRPYIGGSPFRVVLPFMAAFLLLPCGSMSLLHGCSAFSVVPHWSISYCFPWPSIYPSLAIPGIVQLRMHVYKGTMQQLLAETTGAATRARGIDCLKGRCMRFSAFAWILGRLP